jgi:uncharacterized protein (TIGR02145 family)
MKKSSKKFINIFLNLLFPHRLLISSGKKVLDRINSKNETQGKDILPEIPVKTLEERLKERPLEPYEVVIGNQIWMNKNLDVSTFRNGHILFPVTSVEEWGDRIDNNRPLYCDYNFDSSSSELYGKFYNWSAVADERGLAPEGYHIPRMSEWVELINFLGGETEAGNKLKTTHGWKIQRDIDVNGNNSSGFSATPNGECSIFEEYDFFRFNGSHARFWADTENPNNYVNIDWEGKITIQTQYFGKVYGFAVRCLRD